MENNKTDEQLKKDMIKKVDIKKCKKIISMSLKIPDNEINIDAVLREWAENKLHLYKLFGENIKITNHFSMNYDDVAKIGGIDESIANERNECFDNLIDNMNNISPFYRCSLDKSLYYTEIKRHLPYIEEDCISSSLWRNCYRIFYDGTGIKMPTFADFMHRLFQNEKIDIEVSKLMQSITSKQISGFMNLSIDPFDYITMSMNTSNWQSCHSLHNCGNANIVDYGCYSAGIFSYMCDKVSLVAFKTSGTKTKLGWGNRNVLIESKSWRQMIFIHPDYNYFISSRQYPYKSELLCKMAREIIENLIDKTQTNEQEEDSLVINAKTKWIVSRNCGYNLKFITNEIPETNEFAFSHEEIIKDNSLIVDYALNYNDMSADFDYQLTYKKGEEDNRKIIIIGSVPYCPVCGQTRLIYHKHPLCLKCKDKIQY